MTASAMLEREVAGDALPIRTGAFVAVVGPSGAGKDTILALARQALGDEPHAEFVRRVITRPCDGTTEDHDTLTEKAFEQALAEGAFALSWEAHGLSYGLPASVDAVLAKGHVAVANVSRGVISALRLRYANVAVVEITAKPEILAARLAARGRETHGEVLARLARTVAPEPAGQGSVVIDNSGRPEDAAEKFVAIIRKAVAFADVSGTV